MNMQRNLTILLAVTLLLDSCAKPILVKVVNSPTPSVFLTFETYRGLGAVSADDMRLYAHFTQNGNRDEKLILEGENLSVSKLIWTGPRSLVICLSGGITYRFSNEVTLAIGDSDRKVYSDFRQDCEAGLRFDK
jgi:hypothetical protein